MQRYTIFLKGVKGVISSDKKIIIHISKKVYLCKYYEQTQ